MEQLTLHDLMFATRGQLTPTSAGFLPIRRMSIDSRTLQPGDVFWALPGSQHDGHQFVAEAFRRGAVACVCQAGAVSGAAGPVVEVRNPSTALQEFARWYRGTLDALLIGVTGSVGKTTTRDMIHLALSSEFEGIRSRKNFNNTIGLPLSILDADPGHEFIVLEMGAARRGDIAELCSIATPEVGVVTAVGPAHLESFGGLDGVIAGKGELLECLPSSGFAVLPGDDAVLRQMADRAPCPVIFVGEGDDNHLQATRVRSSFEGLSFRVDGTDFSIPVYGRHHLPGALCAIAIAREIGMPLQSVAQGLERFEPIEGRCRLRHIGPWSVIDDSYNASPLSVAAACRLLSELELPGVTRRILILGDMLELGAAADQEHWRIGQLAASLKLDLLLGCGSHADAMARGAEQGGMSPHGIAVAPDLEAIRAVLDCWLEPGDLVLIKGSRSMRMERLMDWLKERARLEEMLRSSDYRRSCA